MITKKQKIEFLKNKLSSNAKWAVKAMFRINENQMPDEIGSVKYYNEKGFSRFDAKIIQSFIDTLHEKQTLSPKQLAVVMKIMPKYAEQLLVTKILPSQENSDKLDRMIGESEFVAM